MPYEVCFIWICLVDPLCLVKTMHFWTLWLFKALCLGLDRLIGPTLVHGSGHGKGRSKLCRLGIFGAVGMVHKSAPEQISVA